MQSGRKPGRSGLCGGDELCERWDCCRIWHAEAIAEELEERDVQFLAGFHTCEQGIAGLTAGFGPGAAGDLAFGDMAADVVFRAVGVQRDFRAVEHQQQLLFPGV